MATPGSAAHASRPLARSTALRTADPIPATRVPGASPAIHWHRCPPAARQSLHAQAPLAAPGEARVRLLVAPARLPTRLRQCFWLYFLPMLCLCFACASARPSPSCLSPRLPVLLSVLLPALPPGRLSNGLRARWCRNAPVPGT